MMVSCSHPPSPAPEQPTPLPSPTATPSAVASASVQPVDAPPPADAQLAAANRYFEQNQLDLALAAYREVIKQPPPDNRSYGYAWYKIAFIHMNKGDDALALSALKKVIDFGMAFTQLQGAPALVDAARKDLVRVYARVGNPGLAYAFLRNLSGDSPGSNDRTFAMMRGVGDKYLEASAYANAATLFRELQVRDPAHRCRWDAYVRHADHAAAHSPWSRTALDAELTRCP